MLLYTIIIPHKNIPELLERCLNSIPYMENIEIIVVDDNSDINIANFHNFPALSRVDTKIILTKEGRGAGFARNVGLRHAKGKYIIFADADDLFSDNIEKILHDYSIREFDIVYLDFISVYSNDVNTQVKSVKYRKSLFKHEPSLLENELRYEFGPPWCKIINREFLLKHDIDFDECKKHNDTMFSLKAGFYAQKIIIDNRIFYLNTYRENSITTSSPSNIADYVDSIMGVELRCLKFLKENNILVAKYRLYYAVESMLRQTYSWAMLKQLFKCLNRCNLLTEVILYTPVYIIHRLLKKLGFSTQYLF